MIKAIIEAITTANKKALAEQEQQRRQAEFDLIRHYVWCLLHGLYDAIANIQIGVGIRPVHYLQEIHVYLRSSKYIVYEGVQCIMCDVGILVEKAFNQLALELLRDRINHIIDTKRKQLSDVLSNLPEDEAWLRASENLALYYGIYVVSIRQENDEIILSVIMPAF